MIQIAPSVLSADFANLAAEIKRVEEGGADVLHLDVMDGHFVPNLTIGPPVIKALRRVTALPMDVHLMVENPGAWVDPAAEAGADWISVHAEADTHLHRTISRIRECGLKAGVALNPATPLCAIEEVLPLVDYVLIMTVSPGFGGQKFIPSMIKKIENLRATVASNGYGARIQVDGGIGPSNLERVIRAGAQIIVMGAAVFCSEMGAAAVLAGAKEIANRYANAGRMA